MMAFLAGEGSAPRCDRVEFTGHQQGEFAGMMDMISELACSVPGAPKDIGAGWTHDRRAGVLGDHQSIKREAPLLAGKWQLGLDEKWRAVHVQRVVDGNRASRGQRHALSTDRLPVTGWARGVLLLAVIRQPDDPEKYEGAVLA